VILRNGRVARLAIVIASLALVGAACSGSAATATPTTPSAAPVTQAPATSGAPSSASPGASAAASTCPNMPTNPVTLTYWENAGTYLSDAGVAQLDQEYMTMYPNVKVVRVPKSLSDIQASQKLAASSANPPDMLVTNAGLGFAAPLVVAKLIIPLDKYATQFGWDTRFPKAILDQFRLQPDGLSWGSGSLYSIGIGASFVGLYYNRDLLTQLGLQVPTTWDEFKASLDAAKKANLVPIAEGSQDPTWTVIHLYTSWQDIVTPTQQINDFEFHAPGATFDTPENLQAAQLSVQMVKDGYVDPSFLGKTNQAAIEDFIGGKALYYLEGTYFGGPIFKAMGDKAGIMVVPPKSGGPFAVTGGAGLGWAISSKSPIPDVAACYIDWRTGQHASDLFVAEGGLPSMIYKYSGTSAFSKSLFDTWADAAAKNALVPYLDDATPTFLTVLTTEIEKLLGGQITPEQYVKDVQQVYAQYKP
jgi:raffinose/stachyose/melibiose transport system substrate-binding protein